jgi:hypothetical protein
VRRRIAKKVATGGLAGLAAVMLLTGPAMAAGPWADRTREAWNLGGEVMGAGHVWRHTTNHYEIAVADKIPNDRYAICVGIYASNGDYTAYCDYDATGAAKHYHIWYDWDKAELVVGGAGYPL